MLIAVIDSGVDTGHPDLKGKLLQGKDFYANDNDPKDDNGHGTLVAGIAAAATGNGEGIASVAPDAKILPVKAFGGADSDSTPKMVADSIRWAAEEAGRLGMKAVLNLSFEQVETGGPIPGSIYDDQVDAAIKYAAGRGAAVVIASGNSGEATTAYDATTPGVVVVGAVDKNDARWSKSSYGRGLDLVAPGVEITSTFWNKANGQSVYGTGEGTSVAVPFVSGTAALLMSRGDGNAEAMKKIMDTAQDLGPKGRDDIFGYGLVDSARALGVSRQQVAPPEQTNPSPAVAASPRLRISPSPKPLPRNVKPPETIVAVPVLSPSPFPSPSPYEYEFEDASVAMDNQRMNPTRYLAAGLALMMGSLHIVRRAWLLIAFPEGVSRQ